MKLVTEIAPKKRVAFAKANRDFYSGGAVIPLAGEEGWSAAALELVKQGKKGIAIDAGDYAAWTKYVYGKALLRGVPYATAGRGQLLALGANNSFREIYEGSRQASDAQVT